MAKDEPCLARGYATAPCSGREAVASVVRTVTLLRALRRRGRAGDEYQDYSGCLWLSVAVCGCRWLSCFAASAKRLGVALSTNLRSQIASFPASKAFRKLTLPRLLKSKVLKTTNLKLLLLMIWTQWYSSTLSLQCFQVV